MSDPVKNCPSDDGKAPAKVGQQSTPEREGQHWISGSKKHGVRKSAGWDALVARLSDSNWCKR